MAAHRILVVDDEPDLREIFRDYFEAEGFSVFEASSGNEAIQVVKENEVDSVISDIRMPDGSGLDFLDYIRNTSETDLHFFLISGFSDVTPEEAFDRGASALFKKPIDLEIVLNSIRKVARLSQEAFEIRPPRYKVKFPVTLEFPKADVCLKTEVLNISRGGILFKEVEGSLKIGDAGQFRIYHRSEHTDCIQGDLKIVRKADSSLEGKLAGFGAQFLKMNENEIEKLQKLLVSLEEKLIPVH